MGRADAWTAVTTRFLNWRDGLGEMPGNVAALIAERPVSIVIVRQNPVTHVKTTLAAQTVRLDLDSRLLSEEVMARGVSSALTSKQRWILLGYRNCLGYDDTDVEYSDTFLLDGQQYVIYKVEALFTDRIIAQARAEG